MLIKTLTSGYIDETIMQTKSDVVLWSDHNLVALFMCTIFFPISTIAAHSSTFHFTSYPIKKTCHGELHGHVNDANYIYLN